MAQITTLVFCSVFFLFSVFSQEKKIKKVRLEHADKVTGEERIEDGIFQAVKILKGNVFIIDEDTKIRCDSAIKYSKSKKIVLYGKIDIKSDTVDLKSKDGGLYFIEDKILFLEKDVEFNNGEVYVKSDLLTHYNKDNLSVMSGGVFFEESRGYTLSDSLYHYRGKSISQAKNNVTVVRDSDNVIIYGDFVEHQSEKKISFIKSNEGKDVRFIKLDTSSTNNKKTDTLFIFSKRMTTYEKHDNASSKKTQKEKQPEKDTIMNSDFINLSSPPSSPPSDLNKKNKTLIEENVRLIRNDVHAICEKAIYLKDEKKIRMFGDVVLWKDEIQVSGDSIDILLKGKGSDIEKVFVDGHAFILMRDTLDPKERRFNQAEGKKAIIFFSGSSKIKRADIINQAKGLYYTYKKKSPRGAAKITADTIRFLFRNEQIKEFEGIGGIIGHQYPEKQVRTSPLKLEGFKLRFSEKPKKPKVKKIQKERTKIFYKKIN